MGVCSCTLKYQGGMGPPEATCAMHKNWLTTFGHILRMRNRLSYMQTLSKTISAWSTVQAVQKQCNKAPVEENSEQHKQLYDAEVFFGTCFH